MLKRIETSQPGRWLKPIRSALIAAGGPIQGSIEVDTPCEHSASVILNMRRRRVTCFLRTAFRTMELEGSEKGRIELPIEWGMAAISNPPRHAVVVASQRALLLVDLRKSTAELLFDEPVFERVAISADGRWAVTSSVPPHWDYLEHEWNGPRVLRLFDLRKKRCVRTWQAHEGRINDLALSGDGRFLVTGSYDRTAGLFDLVSGTQLGTWRSGSRLHAVAITPGAERFAYGSDGAVVTIRRRDGKLVGRFSRCRPEFGCLSLSRDGRTAVSANQGWITVLDVGRSRRTQTFPSVQPDLMSLAIDPTARYAITGELGRRLVLWDLTRAPEPNGSQSSINGIWAGDNTAIVASEGIQEWCLSTGGCREVFPPGSYQVACAPLAGVWAMSKWSVGRGGRIRIGRWGKKLKGGTLWQGNDLITSLSISNNGERLAAVGRKRCFVLNVADRETLWEGAGTWLRPFSPFLSPSGRHLALPSINGFLDVVDLETKATSRSSLPHSGTYARFFLPGSGRVVLRQGFETALLDWKANTVAPLLSGGPLCVGADGKWILTETNLRKLTLWMLPEVTHVSTYTLDAPVSEAALSADGHFVVAGDGSGGVHILERKD